MSRVRPEIRECAKRLLSQEAERNSPSEGKKSGLAGVCEKLNTHLVTLMGVGAYRALLSRGLVIAGEEVQWLGEIQVGSDGSLEGIEALEKQKAPDEFATGAVVLISNFLELLATFIGEALMLHLVREACSGPSKQESETESRGIDEEI